MGMYTELIFQGESKPDLPKDIQELFDYFFSDTFELDIGQPHSVRKLPDHPFFQCQRWNQIGYMSSHYFTPFALRYTQGTSWNNTKYVFLRCDLKNYDDDIQLFLDWIKPYMVDYYGWYWYEEDETPTIFKEGRNE
jgi:hypothetical protein